MKTVEIFDRGKLNLTILQFFRAEIYLFWYTVAFYIFKLNSFVPQLTKPVVIVFDDFFVFKIIACICLFLTLILILFTLFLFLLK